jgi:putative ABC transport system ATP-binding protein
VLERINWEVIQLNVSNKLLQVKEVRKVFGKGQSETVALKGVTFDVLPGEFLGIMGASGSGKTTLLNTIATTLKPTSGQILLEGQNISSFKGSQLAAYRGSKIGYLFQQFELIDNLTAKENIILPLSIHGVNLKEQEKQLTQLVKQFDIEDVLNKFPSQLSGGQKQRVAAARALISNPSIVLADEPTGALDTKNAKLLMDKLYVNNQEQGSTILMVTHDANAASYCSRILYIQDGVIFHELRRKVPGESQHSFYERIVMVMAQLAGGSSNVL